MRYVRIILLGKTVCNDNYLSYHPPKSNSLNVHMLFYVVEIILLTKFPNHYSKSLLSECGRFTVFIIQ